MIYDIFISYRRNGGFFVANHLYDLLVLDGYTVSFDIDNLREGDFDKNLYQRIEQCSDFLVIVDEHAFDRMTNPAPDYDPEKDWMRKEIAYALKLEKNIIPVFLPDASFPKEMPADIEKLGKKNGLKYSKEYFEAFYGKLKEFLHSVPRNVPNSNHDAKGGKVATLQDIIIPVRGLSIVMKPVEGGTFWMGAQKTDSDRKNYDKDAFDEESPVHCVRLNSFYITETLVTQALWKEVMGSEPTHNGGWESRYGKGVNHPAYRVSYNEIVEDFLPKLNQITGKNFRLPREAEWEYAARGGNAGNLNYDFKYSGSDTINDVAWYKNNAGGTRVVKSKSPNKLGIYDMSGNVWEWCSDAWYKYKSAEEVNPKHDGQQDSLRVLRGGGWGDNARSSRVTCRAKRAPSIRGISFGFRLVLSQ